MSESPFESLNLGLHVGDDPVHVTKNRSILASSLKHRKHLCGLIKYSTILLNIQPLCLSKHLQQMPALHRHVHQVCAVMTADCLPILCVMLLERKSLLCMLGGEGYAKASPRKSNSVISHLTALLAYIGPAIGSAAFEVRRRCKAGFFAARSKSRRGVYLFGSRYLANLLLLAQQRLAHFNVQCFVADQCTYQQSQIFLTESRLNRTPSKSHLAFFTNKQD